MIHRASRSAVLSVAWLCSVVVAAACGRTGTSVGIDPAVTTDGGTIVPRSDGTAPIQGDTTAPNASDAGDVAQSDAGAAQNDAAVPPGTATDGVRNDDESDVDCGGARAPRCAIGALCNSQNDCANGQCSNGRCPNVQYFDVNHILSTGQSNAVANAGTPVLTTAQPYQNTMFTSGVMTSSNCDGDGCTGYETPSSMVPLVEGDQFFNYAVETMSSGLANAASQLAQSVYLAGNTVATQLNTHLSLQGRSGNVMYCIRMGGCGSWYPGRGYIYPFEAALRDVQAGLTLARAQGKSYAVRGVTLIHGESDHYGYEDIYPMASSTGAAGAVRNYADALLELQRDYEREVRAISGQTVAVPLYVAQMHSWSTDGNHMTSAVTLDQYEAHKRAPGNVILVGPTYMIPFANDGIHFTNHGNRRLGEYFAKAYAKTALTGTAWEPLRPLRVTRSGASISVKFMVPAPPLVLDTGAVTNPGNYGFEYSDQGASATPTIVAVALESADTVRITLSAEPLNTARTLRYAYTRPTAPGVGPTLGVRGNLRDSDATPSLYGYALQNWSVTFSEPVP